ncbi:MAG: hypothetical protein B6D41_01705 [Chloroflexi bacterium UTCFX4]|jgi:serine/threonine-protein kinase|nr:MAG: hypothetical protein B6D41_01705 [Chloroflexi bacterium UTCFX4]
MALFTNQILHQRYQIQRLLGQGGFGAVYQALDLNLQRVVAVKENLDASVAAQRQFQREAQILVHIRHQHLPQILDYFIEANGQQYLVMEFVAGSTLRQLVQQNGALAQAQALVWANQILDALTELHSNNPPIIHRDIKPDNIIITPRNNATLVDFGIAKAALPGMPTTTGARAVSPGYSPPEQYGNAPTDARSDMYAFGATLYYVLTAVEPPESIQRIITNAPLIPPRQYNARISQNVENAILKAMEINPQGRFQNTALMKQSLTLPAPQAQTHTLPASSAPTVTVLPLGHPQPLPTTWEPTLATASKPASSFPWGWILGLGVLVIIALLIVPNLLPLASPESPPAPAQITVAIHPTSIAQVLSVKETVIVIATALPQPTQTPVVMTGTSIPPTETRIPTNTLIAISASISKPTLVPSPVLTDVILPTATQRSGSIARPTSTKMNVSPDSALMILVSDGSNFFKIDKRPVSVGMFEKFVNATGLFTFAESRGFSDVYTNTGTGGPQTKTVPGASWRNPTGEGAADPNADITQITYEEAQRYCQWAGKRLPTLAERNAAVTNPEIEQRHNSVNPQKDNLYEYVEGGEQGGVVGYFRDLTFLTSTIYGRLQFIPNNILTVRCVVNAAP